MLIIYSLRRELSDIARRDGTDVSRGRPVIVTTVKSVLYNLILI